MSFLQKSLLVTLLMSTVIGWLLFDSYTYSDFKATEHIIPPEIFNSDTGFQYYWIITNERPIFALPGTNLENLENTLKILLIEDTLESVSLHYPESERDLIQKSLYQSTYLHTLKNTESARRKFKSYPTTENLERYHASLIKTLEAYVQDTTIISDAFLSFDTFHLNLLNGITSNTYMGEGLLKASIAAKKRLQEEHNRYNCYKNFSKNCQKIPRQPLQPLQPTTSLLGPVMPDEISRDFAKILDQTGKTIESLPLVIIENTYCYPYRNPAFYHVRKWHPTLAPDTIHAISGTPVNDLLFHDTVELQHHPFYKILYDAGIPYVLQPLNDYMCVDAGLDTARIRTSLFIHQTFKDKPMFQTKHSSLKQLSFLENKIITSTSTISEKDIFNLLLETEKFINKYGEKKLLQLLTYEEYNRLQEIFLVWRSKSAYFELEMGSFKNMYSMTNSVLLPIFAIPKEVLFISRSYASALYQLNNGTLHSHPILLTEEQKKISLEDFKLTSYRNDLRDISIVDIQKMINQYGELHRSFATD